MEVACLRRVLLYLSVFYLQERKTAEFLVWAVSLLSDGFQEHFRIREGGWLTLKNVPRCSNFPEHMSSSVLHVSGRPDEAFQSLLVVRSPKCEVHSLAQRFYIVVVSLYVGDIHCLRDCAFSADLVGSRIRLIVIRRLF